MWRPFLWLGVTIAVSVAAGVALAPMLGEVLAWGVIVIGGMMALGATSNAIDAWSRRPPRRPPHGPNAP